MSLLSFSFRKTATKGKLSTFKYEDDVFKLKPFHNIELTDLNFDRYVNWRGIGITSKGEIFKIHNDNGIIKYSLEENPQKFVKIFYFIVRQYNPPNQISLILGFDKEGYLYWVKDGETRKITDFKMIHYLSSENRQTITIIDKDNNLRVIKFSMGINRHTGRDEITFYIAKSEILTYRVKRLFKPGEFMSLAGIQEDYLILDDKGIIHEQKFDSRLSRILEDTLGKKITYFNDGNYATSDNFYYNSSYSDLQIYTIKNVIQTTQNYILTKNGDIYSIHSGKLIMRNSGIKKFLDHEFVLT